MLINTEHIGLYIIWCLLFGKTVENYLKVSTNK